MQRESLPFLFSVKFLFCLLAVAGGVNSAAAGPDDVAAAEPEAVLKLRRTVVERPVSRADIDGLFQNYCRATAPEHRRQLKEELLLRKDDVLPTVSKKLETGSRKEKISAVKLVKAAGWAEAESNLTKVLSNVREDEAVRVGACFALGEIGTKTAGQQLLDQLEVTPSLQMKRASLLALGNLKDPAYAGKIAGYRENPDDLVELYAEVALAKMGKLTGKPKVAIELSKLEDWTLRSEAIRALGIIGGKDAINRLNEIADKYAQTLPGVALAADQARAKAELVGKSREDAVKYISLKINDADREIRVWAINVAAKELGEEGLKILEKKAGEPGEIGRTAAFHYLVRKQKKQMVMPPKSIGR